MAKTLNKFYFIPKERIVNLFGIETKFNSDGSIACFISGNSQKITLYDYLIPPNIITTQSASAYLGKIGTRAEIYCEWDSGWDWLKSEVDKVLKQYEL